MNATINLEKHFPVLLNELVSIISPLYGGTFIDCTFGQGGYSQEVLKNKNNKIIAIDRDKETLKISKTFEKKYGSRFHFQNITFKELNKFDTEKRIKGIFFDLGFSTNQINDPKKGMSFKGKGKINMGMGLNNFTAGDAVNSLDINCLNQIFKFFGEEKKAKIISKRIILERKKKYLNIEDLIIIIDKAYKGKRKKIHNATKVFQALRIFVNQEISQLIHGLINAFKILPVGGVIAVVTFHSLEDKIVKFFFKNYSEIKNSSRYLPQKLSNLKLFNFSNKKTIFPTKKEIEINPASRSAKLRYALKINHTEDFSEFIKKFNYLIKIENLYKEL